MQTQHYIEGQHNDGYYNPRNTSVYGYTYQNPVKYVDPNGKQVDITITNKVVGTTQIRLIGNRNYEDAPSTMTVNLYRMTVTDKKTGTVSNYAVARDAPVATGSKSNWWGFADNDTTVKNTAFEPKEAVGRYKGIGLNYPSKVTNLEALALRNPDGSSALETDPNRQLPPGGQKGIAKGVMIHVGGTYTKNDGSSSITGSFGCFGVETELPLMTLGRAEIQCFRGIPLIDNPFKGSKHFNFGGFLSNFRQLYLKVRHLLKWKHF